MPVSPEIIVGVHKGERVSIKKILKKKVNQTDLSTLIFLMRNFSMLRLK
jgi:hypothetical protein